MDIRKYIGEEIKKRKGNASMHQDDLANIIRQIMEDNGFTVELKEEGEGVATLAGVQEFRSLNKLAAIYSAYSEVLRKKYSSDQDVRNAFGVSLPLKIEKLPTLEASNTLKEKVIRYHAPASVFDESEKSDENISEIIIEAKLDINTGIVTVDEEKLKEEGNGKIAKEILWGPHVIGAYITVTPRERETEKYAPARYPITDTKISIEDLSIFRGYGIDKENEEKLVEAKIIGRTPSGEQESISLALNLNDGKLYEPHGLNDEEKKILKLLSPEFAVITSYSYQNSQIHKMEGNNISPKRLDKLHAAFGMKKIERQEKKLTSAYIDEISRGEGFSREFLSQLKAVLHLYAGGMGIDVPTVIDLDSGKISIKECRESTRKINSLGSFSNRNLTEDIHKVDDFFLRYPSMALSKTENYSLDPEGKNAFILLGGELEVLREVLLKDQEFYHKYINTTDSVIQEEKYGAGEIKSVLNEECSEEIALHSGIKA